MADRRKRGMKKSDKKQEFALPKNGKYIVVINLFNN